TLFRSWSHQLGDVRAADELKKLADAVKVAFNARFWNESARCCYDVINEAADASIRPNQILAVSLPHAVLDISRHEQVVARVVRDLLTPMGVRTLAPGDPNYQAHYRGNVVERDRAHHQGSVHPWLLGPMVTAYLKIHGHGSQARREARQMLQGCLAHIENQG